MSDKGRTLVRPVCSHDPASLVQVDGEFLCPTCDRDALSSIKILVQMTLRRRQARRAA